MLRAIADGEDDPEKLANFARRTMKKTKEELELALQGYVNPDKRLVLKTILIHIDFLTEQMELLDQEIAQRGSSTCDITDRIVPVYQKRNICRHR
ncbi:hypothetical protein [Cytobacillus sp.]|uniref:hypothetical protein n=1 Tax=Cytobacillus sp. TaxID=2675269 RepID=UPI0028BEEDDB|nr:hypothetical protein [Cytobacillus sp.]